MARPARHAWLWSVPLAHRGRWGDGVPENSLAAFAAAATAGVGIELDVRLAADGVPVVVHDADLSRSAGSPAVVADTTSGELGAIRLGGTDQGVPTLSAALATAGDAPVMVEVKTRRARVDDLARAVADRLADHDGPTCVASFNVAVLRWFRRHRRDVARVLTASPRRNRSGRAVGAGIAALPVVGPVALSYHLAGLDLSAVRRRRAAGLPVVAWTVRSVEDLAVARARADNVIFESLPLAAVT